MDSLLPWVRDNVPTTVMFLISMLGLILAWKQLMSARTQVSEAREQTRITESGVLPSSTEVGVLNTYREMLLTRSPTILVELDQSVGRFTSRDHLGAELLRLDKVRPDDYLDLTIGGTLRNASGIHASIRAPDEGFHFVADNDHSLPRLHGYLYLLPAEATARFEWTLSLTMNKALAYYSTWYYEEGGDYTMAFMSSMVERIWKDWSHLSESRWGSHSWELHVYPAPGGPDMMIFDRVIEVSVNKKLVGGHEVLPGHYVWKFLPVRLLVSQQFREIPTSAAELRRILKMNDEV